MYNDAINDYSKAVELDPKNAYAYYNRGISYDKKGEYNLAIKDFAKAIELDSSKPDFYHNKGFAMKKKNLVREAIIEFNECIRLDKNHFKAYYNRANCYERLGEFDKAYSDYMIANSIVPNNPNTLTHIGILMDR